MGSLESQNGRVSLESLRQALVCGLGQPNKLSQHRPCSTWNTPVTGLENGATRLPLIGRRSPGGPSVSPHPARGWTLLPGDGTTDLWAASEAVLERLRARNPKTPPALPDVTSPEASTPPAAPGPPSGSLGELISFRPGLRPPAEVSERPGLWAQRQSAALVEVNALTRRCSRWATPEVAFERLSCLIHAPGTMQKRCGVIPTAVEPGPRVLLSQRLELVAREPGQVHSPARQSRRRKVKRAHWRVKMPESRWSPLPFTHANQREVLPRGPGGGSPASLVGKVASSITRSTWNTSATGLWERSDALSA